MTETMAALASSLVVAWDKYVHLFGEPPHGTGKQMRALLQLMPDYVALTQQRMNSGGPKGDEAVTSLPTDRYAVDDPWCRPSHPSTERKCTWPNCDQPSGHDYCYEHCFVDGSPSVPRPERGEGAK